MFLKPMTLARLLTAAAMFLFAGSAAAQVVVLADPASGTFSVQSGLPNTWFVAHHDMARRAPGVAYQLLLASRDQGFGAMFCIRPDGGPTEFFIAFPRATSKEAMDEARKKAWEAGRSRELEPYWCKSWHNTTEYGLDVPGELTAVGVRG